MKIFLSYPSSQKDRVAEINYALEAEGHAVFFDRDELPSGAGYHARIREAIESSELFIFIITPESVTPGRYTLTELKFARGKWENPEGRLLPVLLEATPFDKMPAYLRAVTILEPEGNVPAEVAATVVKMAELQPSGTEAGVALPPSAARARPLVQSPSYEALRLCFGKGDGEVFPVEVVDSPEGTPAVQSCRLDPGEIEGLLWAPGAGGEATVRRAGGEAALPTAECARRVGEKLYESLFGAELGPTLEGRLRDLDPQQGAGVRFVIDTTEAPELGGIPWEFTYRARDDDFLFSDRLTPVVRWLDLERPLPTLEVELPLRLLVAVAAPIDQPELRVGDEIASLDNELGDLAADGILAPIHLDHASLEDLDRALVRHAPHVLHFIGHGDVQDGEGVLVLESEEAPGTSAPVSGRRLAVLLRNHLSSLRLVFLNSCLGAAISARNPFSGVAQSLMRRGMPAVIAMQFPIPDRAAVALAREFYRYLAAGLPVDAALTSARAFLFAKGYEVEWGAPALHMRTPDARLFAIPGAPPPVVATQPVREVPAGKGTQPVEPAERPLPPGTTVEPSAGAAPPPVQPPGLPPPSEAAPLGAAGDKAGRFRKPALGMLMLLLVAAILGVGGFLWFWQGAASEPEAAARGDGDSATPAAQEAVTLPGDLVGQPLDEVRRRLEDLGLAVGGEIFVPDEAEPGTVVETIPPPGTVVGRGDAIDLWVSEPPPAETEPSGPTEPSTLLTVYKRWALSEDRRDGLEDPILLVGGRAVAIGEPVEVSPGRHRVSEIEAPGRFRAAFEGDCDDGGWVVLETGDRKTCTVVNRPVAPRERPPACEALLGLGSASCFSLEPVPTLEELQTFFARHAAELRSILEQAEWGGDPEDLLRAVREARPGDGTVTPGRARPGDRWQWIAGRERGTPVVLRDPRLSIDEPLDLWQIRVESPGLESLFLVPWPFPSLAFEGARQLAGPTCEISATFDPATDTVTVVATSDEEIKIASVGIPGGTGSVRDLQSVGSGRWIFQPTTDGTYNFNAEATRGKQTTTCSASVRVERLEPIAEAIEIERRYRWITRGYPAWIGASTDSRDASGQAVSVDDGWGLGLGLEYLFHSRLGIEAGLLFADLDAERAADGELRYRHLTAGLNIHLTPDRRLDLFVGPLVGLVRYGGDFDDDFAWGVNLGVDVPVTRGWLFTGGVRYLRTSAEVPASGIELDLDPVVLSAGLAVRF